MNIKNSQHLTSANDIPFGNVYIMTHSLFSDVIRIGCTPSNAEEYATSLSAKTPGHYELFYSLACDNPCMVKKQLKQHFTSQKYINEFYEVSPENAKTVLKREAMKIPVLSMH